MNYASIKTMDTTNGQGYGVSLFVSGCRHHCKGCFNPETWNFSYGTEFTAETMQFLIESLSRPYVDFFAVLGGEPFEPENVGTVLEIITKVKAQFPNIKIYVWSGSSFEDLIKIDICKKVLSLCDYLTDGEFVEAQKNYKLFLRGSENQRVLDLPQSLEAEKPILSNLNKSL